MICLLVLLPAMASAADLLVPQDHATLQEAIDAASTGDHIIVSGAVAGSFRLDKDLTIHGVGMTDTVLTGDPGGAVVDVRPGVTAELTFLTVDAERSGRAIESVDAVLALRGVKIAQGEHVGTGAGVEYVRGVLTIEDSIICGNVALGAGEHGGGLRAEDAEVEVTRSVFLDNQTDGRGGALHAEASSASVVYGTFLGNVADRGAAVSTKDVQVAVERSIIADNVNGNGSAAALDGEGAADGDGFTGSDNLYDNNVPLDVELTYLPGDELGPPDLTNASAPCLLATMADFTSSPGGDAAIHDVGAAGIDSDGDGYGDRIDCDPSDSTIHPDANEIAGDGVDQNCDGIELCHVDGDGDGEGGGNQRHSTALGCDDATHDLVPGGVTDCDDADATVQSMGLEVPCDGVDNDCNPNTPDLDGSCDSGTPADTGTSPDTGAPPDTADTAAPPDTADTGAPPDTADTGAPPDTADTGASPDTADTGASPDAVVTDTRPDKTPEGLSTACGCRGARVAPLLPMLSRRRAPDAP